MAQPVSTSDASKNVAIKAFILVPQEYVTVRSVNHLPWMISELRSRVVVPMAASPSSPEIDNRAVSSFRPHSCPLASSHLQFVFQRGQNQAASPRFIKVLDTKPSAGGYWGVIVATEGRNDDDLREPHRTGPNQ